MSGTHTICRLIADRYIVRSLLRLYSSYSRPGHRNLELVEGNFTDAETLCGAMPGCDFVIHCAAMTGQSGHTIRTGKPILRPLNN